MTNTNIIDKYNIYEENDIFGIDLGTSNCCIALWKNGTYKIIEDKYKNRTMPSIVGITENKIYVGNEVLIEKNIKTGNIIYGIKRLIGKKYDDILEIKKNLTYKIKTNENNDIIICSDLDNNKKTFFSEEIVAYILREIKQSICNYINIPINEMPLLKVVVTIPAYFNDLQRQATLDSIKIAGFDCLKILNEPTAAAMAYGYEKRYKSDGNDHTILVYDMGGGTTDVSILNICDGVFEVLTSTGNTLLGGIDFDNVLIKYCLDSFGENINNINSNNIFLLKNICEDIKKKISSDDNLHIFIHDFYDNRDLNIKITQNIFESLCESLLQKSIGPILDALNSCELHSDDIEDIIMVGGSTKLKILRNKISKIFNKDPICNINPDEVVAIGASIQGYILTKKSDPFTDNIVLLDITSLSLGVEVMGGIMDVIIKRNTIIPIIKRKKYTNDTDNETSIKIKIFEGERQMTKNNIYLGEIILNNLTPVPRGCADIDVIFKIDINGIVSVTAHELNNNVKQNINLILNKGRLSNEQIDKIIEESVELEKKDNVEKKKKQIYHNIIDNISNIKTNLNSVNLKMNDEKKKIFQDEINIITQFIDQNIYDDVLIDKYIDILSHMEKIFGNLLIRNYNEESYILSFNDDELNENINLSNESIDDLNIELNDEIINEFTNTCNEILKSCNDDKLSDNISEKIKSYINECLCWFYTENSNKNINYNDLNKMILQIKNYYCSITDDNIILNDINILKKELYEMCSILIEFSSSIDVCKFKSNIQLLFLSFLNTLTNHFILIYNDIDDIIVIKNMIDTVTFFSNQLHEYLFENNIQLE